MTTLPETTTLVLARAASVLRVTLNRPEARNAMSLVMVRELESVFEAVSEDRSVRTIVIRGAGGHFSAGGDVKDMAGARMAEVKDGRDPIYEVNRAFGRMLERAEAAPQALVAVCEGAVLGGGFGLACVADVTLTSETAEFGLPETGLGLPPAQIAPFLVKRLGLSQTRRLAVTGGRFDGREALRIGLAHECFADAASLDAGLSALLGRIARCAPGAIATTKRIVLAVGSKPISELLDEGAVSFAASVRSAEGTEGTMAFMQKRTPTWNDEEKGA
jgi:isohexenylglutaconyl-CoA hydratase